MAALSNPISDAKRLVLLGSTGSIGTQALEVAEKLGCPVVALTAHSRVETMEEQVRRFRPRLAVMVEEKAAADLRVRLADTPVRVEAGVDGLCEAACLEGADLVLNSVVGMVGLRPTLAALEAGRDVALANKETLVAGGALVMEAAARQGARLLPVDSEHSAIFQCLQGAPPENRALRRLILTASGGPFFGKSREELKRVGLQEALKHPNWSMGAKITIDSATMMNKGLELIEARWLFDVPPENIDIIIHRESVVHSLIEYDDHSVIAQLGVPDMRLPIQYALTWPMRRPSPVKALHLTEWGKLTFFPPDDEAFPCIGICREAVTRGGLYPAAVNAANEEAVALFRKERIGFLDIGELVGAMLERPFPGAGRGIPSLEEILAADREVRRYTAEAAQRLAR
ncbi:MAG TPA: 1-deoxy-D-xylulose-5-phosphate reductoisomerase [Firmicutes bacterium]|nr:1-deoxy-D-xylulose-5-phosphate reductoisomerase [Bacillota bacterium]